MTAPGDAGHQPGDEHTGRSPGGPRRRSVEGAAHTPTPGRIPSTSRGTMVDDPSAGYDDVRNHSDDAEGRYRDRLPLAVEVERRTPPRHPRRRLKLVIVAALAALMIWLAVSLGGALTDPALGSSVSSRFAEWARGHGGASVVNWVESEWYSHHPPVVGGKPPAGAIRRPTAKPVTVPSTVAHLPSPPPIGSGRRSAVWSGGCPLSTRPPSDRTRCTPAT
jgi:hypothetical protein